MMKVPRSFSTDMTVVTSDRWHEKVKSGRGIAPIIHDLVVLEGDQNCNVTWPVRDVHIGVPR